MTTKIRLSQLAVLTVALASYGATALATLCGDDVNGRDVPCACGDTVVSNLTLSGDPIATDTCDSDGLVVRALDASAAITIDLAGHTLQGKGKGTGILVIYGGPGGARIVSSGSRATIEQFRDGVSAHGADSLTALEDVIVLRNARDGVRVHADGYQVRNVDARASGRDGFAIMGSRFRVVGTLAATNVRNGYFIMGRNGLFGLTGQGNAARGNGAAGFMVGGDTHQIADCIASMNNKEGLHLFGDGHDVIDCHSDDNLGDGLMGMGNRWRVGGNSAANNGGNGIYIRGPNLTDLGRNTGLRNGSLIAEPRTVIECEINGVACR